MVAYDPVQRRVTPSVPCRLIYYSRWCAAHQRPSSDSYSRLRWLTLYVSSSNPAAAFGRNATTAREHLVSTALPKTRWLPPCGLRAHRPGREVTNPTHCGRTSWHFESTGSDACFRPRLAPQNQRRTDTLEQALKFAPKDKTHTDSSRSEEAGRAIVTQIQRAADLANEDCDRAMSLAHKLSMELTFAAVKTTSAFWGTAVEKCSL
jgi:hypothetical protein